MTDHVSSNYSDVTGYEDDPTKPFNYIRKLSKPDLEKYVNGYLLACCHIREVFNKGKVDCLNTLMINQEQTISVSSLIDLLDLYEEVIREKETLIHNRFLST